MLSKKTRYLTSICFIAPAFVVFVVLFVCPVVLGFRFSFTNWDGLNPNPDFVGLDNFKEFFTNPNAVAALGRTLLSTLLIVSVQNAVAVFVAALLDTNIKGANFFKTVFFFPCVLSSAIVAYLWTFVFDPLNGLVASILRAFGESSVKNSNWLGNPDIALFVVIGVIAWQWFGYNMVIYMTGLQSIPVEYYEASDIDGVNAWQKFWRIKFPLIAQAFTINMAVSVIGALMAFDHFILLTYGGPGRATETLMVLIYKESFKANRMGYGAAVSMILLAIVLLLAVFQTKLLRSRELEG